MGVHNSISNTVKIPSYTVIHPHTFEISSLIAVFTILDKDCLSDSFTSIKQPVDVMKFINGSIDINRLDKYYFKKDIIDASCKQICPNKTTVWKEGDTLSCNFKLVGYNTCHIQQYINVSTVTMYLNIEYDLKMSIIKQLIKSMIANKCDTVNELISMYGNQTRQKLLDMRLCGSPDATQRIKDECSILCSARKDVENVIIKYSDIDPFDSHDEINNRLRICTSNYELFIMCTKFANSDRTL